MTSSRNIDGSIAKHAYCFIADSGYKAICPKCSKRHQVDVALKGKERYIDYVDCSKCSRTTTVGENHGSDEEDA